MQFTMVTGADLLLKILSNLTVGPLFHTVVGLFCMLSIILTKNQDNHSTIV